MDKQTDTGMQSPMTTLGQDVWALIRYRLRGRRGVLLALAGASFGWSWLVAVGIAPILLGLLPCVAMCALGLCMMGKGAKSSSSDEAADTTDKKGAGPSDAP